MSYIGKDAPLPEREPDDSDFSRLLRGEIDAKEYVRRLDERVGERERIERATMDRVRRTAVHYGLSVTSTPSQEVAVSVKRKTVGVDLKVPIQAVVTILAFVLSYFGIDLTPEVSGAIAIVLGAVAGFFSPAPQTVASS